jgi:hypothetical protein
MLQPRSWLINPISRPYSVPRLLSFFTSLKINYVRGGLSCYAASRVCSDLKNYYYSSTKLTNACSKNVLGILTGLKLQLSLLVITSTTTNIAALTNTVRDI